MKETFLGFLPARHLLLILMTAGGPARHLKIILLTGGLLWQLSVVKAQFGQTGLIGKNAFYAEWFGNGVYYSLNYERIFYSAPKFQAGVRIGAMAYSNLFILPEKKLLYVFPMEINGLFGKHRQNIEIGIGNSFSTGRFYHWVSVPQQYYRQFILLARLGFRYYSKQGVVIRIAALPLLAYKLGYLPDMPDDSDFGIMKPATAHLINDETYKRYTLGISAGLSFGYAF